MPATPIDTQIFFHCDGLFRKSTSIKANLLCRKKNLTSKSTDRLHVTQHFPAERRKKSGYDRKPLLSRRSLAGLAQRPATSHAIDSNRRLSDRESNDPDFALPSLEQDYITEKEARCYLTLPEKVRKLYFTRKEQILLAVRCKNVLEDTSPELAHDAVRRCLISTRKSDETNGYKRPSTSKSVDSTITTTTSKSSPESETFEQHALDSETEIVDMYSRPSMSDGKDSVSISEPQPIQPPPEPKEPSRKPHDRTFTLVPVPLPPPTLAPAPSQPSPDTVPHFALSARLSRPFNTGPVSSLPTTPTTPTKSEPSHDSEARDTIRDHPSPQKIDEALEFGFSEPNDESLPSSSTEESFPLQAPPSIHSDDEDEDHVSVGPRTPTPSESHPAIKQPSFDSGISLPSQQMLRLPKTPTRRSPCDSFHDSEKTIHMTLTPRNLRSPADKLYDADWQFTPSVDVQNHDPLALEQLQICDDPTGAHGAFAVHDAEMSKGMKRVWSRLLRSH